MLYTNYYFDMDGVLCNLDKRFYEMTGIDTNTFHTFDKSEKERIKSDLFTYEFFRNLEPFQFMLDRLLLLKNADVHPVKILTATGHINVDEVKQAKRDWIAQHVGEIDIIFVDKVQNKGKILVGAVGHHHLFDDRVAAIDSWRAMDNFNPGLRATATLITM